MTAQLVESFKHASDHAAISLSAVSPSTSTAVPNGWDGRNSRAEVADADQRRRLSRGKPA
jgi:hypothetical protein